MSSITVIPMDKNRLWAGEICYSLHKVYPAGGKFYVGHFRSAYDYEAEVEWLDEHEPEPGPVRYEAHEESDWGLTDDICDSVKYVELIEAVVQRKWAAQQKARKEYDDWKAELAAKGIDEHDLPLIKRKFPRLFGEQTLADLYWSCIWEYRPMWEAERKRLNELVAKAGLGEKVLRTVPDALVIKYALRYIYDDAECARIEQEYKKYM